MPKIECLTGIVQVTALTAGLNRIWVGHGNGTISTWKIEITPEKIGATRDGAWPAHKTQTSCLCITAFGEVWSGSWGGSIRAWTWEDCVNETKDRPSSKGRGLFRRGSSNDKHREEHTVKETGTKKNQSYCIPERIGDVKPNFKELRSSDQQSAHTQVSNLQVSLINECSFLNFTSALFCRSCKKKTLVARLLFFPSGFRSVRLVYGFSNDRSLVCFDPPMPENHSKGSSSRF